jgi:hypothetical protein
LIIAGSQPSRIASICGAGRAVHARQGTATDKWTQICSEFCAVLNGDPLK